MNRKMELLFIVLITLLAWIPASAEDEQPSISELTIGEWTQIAVDDGMCLYGEDYSFFVRPAATPTDNLLIYFQGGGACWDGLTCGNIGEFASFYNVNPDLMDFYNSGIFAFDNPDNPLADYNMVFLPYCTGDVHTGRNAMTFDVPPEAEADFDEIDVFFNGHKNTQQVLSWVYENFQSPDDLVIAGCSAGGYGAVSQAPFIMEHYTDVPALMFADASAGVLADGWAGLQTWGTLDELPAFIPALAEVAPDDYDTTYHIEQAALYFPDNDFAQFNSYIDGVQLGFYAASQGEALDFENNGAAVAAVWSRNLLGNTRNLAELDNYRYYIAGGFDHCVINNDLFYLYNQNNVSFNQWFTDILERDATNVECSLIDGSCFEPPITDQQAVGD